MPVRIDRLLCWRIFLWGVGLYFSMWLLSSHIQAQGPGAGGYQSESRRLEELERRLNEIDSAPDLDTKLRALEAALRLEGEIVAWPKTWAPRGKIKARLLFYVGANYFDRTDGARGDNLEKALAAYTAGLSAIGDQDAEWIGYFLYALGDVYLARE